MAVPGVGPVTAADWIDNLARLAEAATPGPWVADHSEEDNSAVKQEGRAWWDGLAFCGRPADAKFIAAVNPTTILRLIEAARRAEDYNAEADRHASRVVAMEAENEDLTAERDALAARLAAVEALADRWRHCGDPGDPRRQAASALRVALSTAPTDTTKEN